MKQELKDVLGVLVILLPACVFIFIWWLNCPMYAETKEQERLGIQTYLTGHYYNPDIPYKQVIMEHYGFTDADINPSKLVQQYVEAHNGCID
jgi:hypothetical protein